MACGAIRIVSALGAFPVGWAFAAAFAIVSGLL
jgi:hypothetical protein